MAPPPHMVGPSFSPPMKSEGTVIGRAGQVSVRYDDAAGKTWIGGSAVTVVDGTFRLP